MRDGHTVRQEPSDPDPRRDEAPLDLHQRILHRGLPQRRILHNHSGTVNQAFSLAGPCCTLMTAAIRPKAFRSGALILTQVCFIMLQGKDSNQCQLHWSYALATNQRDLALYFSGLILKILCTLLYIF